MNEFKISCKNVPRIFFDDKNIAKNHFRKFGKIKKMIFKPKSKVCIIEYANQESLQKAIDLGCLYENNIIEIVKANPISARKIVENNDPEWLPDPEVLEELNAMSGASSFRDTKRYNLRPEAMVVDYNEDKQKKMKHSLVEKKPVNNFKPLSGPRISFSEDQLDLLETIKKCAYSIEDKYKILDARDKLIRFISKKSVNKCGATQGTCPDMCPEKERLLRVIQHQVSIYEQNSSKEMDPALAIKQYSRSSADQEAPLPHELRPVSILQTTMSYLIHRIMNLGDNSDINIGDWYHFLWDRTRSIRKDITQQELCSQGSVTLVEQCARFHIHCSARLVAEEPSVFDQKINTENLTKCLQTLKYMYNDLRLKGEKCANEAEFRSYIILLNLNDGNFMWEVQKLLPEIQKSKEIRSAIEIYQALDMNNFIKFFKLVRNSPYLNACILMRYFMQVRIRALTILIKCYTPRITKVTYPTEELTINLGFESTSDTVEFLQNCGLNMNSSGTGVILDKNMFTTPEFTYTSLDRSVNIVESKRKFLSVGQIVCGGTLPTKHFENYVPQSSFSDKGLLKIDTYSEMKDLEDIIKSTEKDEKMKVSLKNSPKNKNPYVFIKDSKEDISLTKTQKTEETEFSISKTSSIFAPVVSNIFSSNNFNTSEKTVKTNIFGGQDSKNEPSIPERISSKSQDLKKEKQKQIVITTSQSDNIFGNVSEIKEKDQMNAKIFGGQSEVTSGSLFGETSKFEQNINSTLSIFGNNLIAPSDTISTEDHSKNKINFEEIKWELDSPKKIVESTKTFEHIFFQPSQKSSKELKNNVPKNISFNSFVPNPVNEVIKNEHKSMPSMNEIEKESLEKEQWRLEDKQQKLEQLRKEKIREIELEKDIALKKEEEKIKLKEQERVKEEERKKIEDIEKTILILVPEIINKVEMKVKNDKLEDLKGRIHKRNMLQIFRKWQSKTIKKKKKRKALDCSPLWVCSRSPNEEAAELKTESQNLTLKYMKRYKRGEPVSISHKNSNEVQKIDFKKITEALVRRHCQFRTKFNESIYWKSVISIPDSVEMTEGKNRIEYSLQSYFQWKKGWDGEFLLEQYSFNHLRCVNYCIEKQNGLQVKNYDANGFIFIGKNYNQLLRKRILENIKGFGVFVKIPIVLILHEDPHVSINFDELVEQGIISNYLVLIDNLSPTKLINNVEKGLIFLVNNTELPSPVLLDTMKAFLIKNLCNEIWKKANSFCKWNSVYKNCLRNPNTVIDLHNEALSKIKDLILKKGNYEFAEFPTVFKELLPSEIPDYFPCDYRYIPEFCREKNYLAYVSNILDSFKLSPLMSWPPKNQNELENLLITYLSNLLSNFSKPFNKVLSIFLKHVALSSNFEDIKQVVWTDIVEVIIMEKIKEIDFSLNGTEYFNKSIYNQLVIVFNPEILNEYVNTAWFYVNNPIIKKHIENNSYVPRNEEKDKYDVTSEEINETILQAEVKMKSMDHSDIQNQMKKFKYLLSDLEESLLINKKINSNLNTKLSNIMKNN